MKSAKEHDALIIKDHRWIKRFLRGTKCKLHGFDDRNQFSAYRNGVRIEFNSELVALIAEIRLRKKENL